MKLVIQIPCLNEEGNILKTLNEIPLRFSGVSEVEVLIIDDGSTDQTVSEARKSQHHVTIVSHPRNLGLAKAFRTGLDYCISVNADLIVNTDADNQYVGADIQKLIDPIIEKRYDMVIGARPISEHEEFSRTKKILQRLGSAVVRILSGTTIKDAPSGFRALSNHAARTLQVFTGYTYTLETIIQAGLEGLRIISIPIRVNPATRPSRLLRGNTNYIVRSVGTMIRALFYYGGLKVYAKLAFGLFFVSLLIGGRWIYFYLFEVGRTNVPSLVLMAMLVISGMIMLSTGLIMDAILANRQIQVRLLNNQRDDIANRK